MLWSLHMAVYWGTSLVLDFVRPLMQLLPWRSHHFPLKNTLPDTATVLFNQCCITYPLSVIWEPWLSGKEHGIITAWDVLYYASAFLFLEELLFYYTHRFLHLPWFYKRIHYWHHRWKEPIAMVALSAHPVEYLTSNLLPLLAGPFLLQPPLIVTQVWIVVATLNVVMAHSGFALLTSGNHDLHHKHLTGNFGVMGILDQLHGTSIR